MFPLSLVCLVFLMFPWGTEDTGHHRQWKHGVHKTRKDKPETVETWGTQDKKGKTRDSRNMGYTRQERKNQRQ
jgi:hypothetical protein